MKKENLISVDSPNILKCYWIASRPKTWIASISPVVIGASLAIHKSSFSYIVFILTLLFSLFIQIGTNFANDFFDFIKGADTKDRKGPLRATQQGWIQPSTMLKASLIVFGCAFLFALPLMYLAGLWSLPIALVCILLGLLYTGGPRPLGYLGLGEILVFIFFGPVAVCGAYFLQTGKIDSLSFLSSLPPAFISTAILAANNLRDEITDRTANKRTLIVRFGRTFGSYEYTLLVLAAALVPWIIAIQCQAPKIGISSLFFIPAYPLIKKSFQFKDPLELISLLQGTSLLLFIYTFLFSFLILW